MKESPNQRVLLALLSGNQLGTLTLSRGGYEFDLFAELTQQQVAIRRP